MGRVKTLLIAATLFLAVAPSPADARRDARPAISAATRRAGRASKARAAGKATHGREAARKHAPAQLSKEARPIPKEDAAPATGLSARGPTRIDFDERLIEGQTNKTGAVYLFDRKETVARSMIQARSSYRDEVLRTVFE